MDAQAKSMVVLARVIPVLFFLPITVSERTEYTLFHANQCLLLFLLGVAIYVLGRIPILGWIAAGLAGMAWFVFWILGIVWACRDEMKVLPIIGEIEILK